MSGRAPAVVIGLDCITGLQTARILAARQVPVVALAGNLRHFACRTNVCERILASDLASERLIERLERLGPELASRAGGADGKAVLYPCTDASVLLLSRFRDRLHPWYSVMLAEPDVVELLMDKTCFYNHALRSNLPIPSTFLLGSRRDAEGAVRDLPFPAVIKPPVKTAAWEAQTSVKAFKVADADELLAVYDRVAPWAETLIAQEWIAGGDDSLYSCNCYFDRESRPLVTFVARKLRQWPPYTGTSCLGEECRNDEVLAQTVRLFGDVAYRGLGYVEMKWDPRTRRHVVIEPNVGRPTGRSAIAEGGGVELLYTMYCDAAGLPLPEQREQRYLGTKWLDVRRDLQSSFYYARRGELSPLDWARSLRGPKTHAVFSRSDPRPFMAELLQAGDKATRWTRRRRSDERGQRVSAEEDVPPPTPVRAP